MLYWDRGEAKVKSYATASSAKGTVIRVEIEVTDRFALERILGQLHEAKHPPKPKPEPKATLLALTDGTCRALPAPPLGLPFYGDDK